MLHIHNGDSTASALRKTDVPGESIVWCDVLHEGPAVAGLTAEQWRTMRAEFHAGLGWGKFQECLDYLLQMDNDLARFSEHEEVVLWFEHDLFDQLILIRLLDWFAERDLGQTRLTLICVGAFPGVERFIGLGQLSSEQLATL